MSGWAVLCIDHYGGEEYVCRGTTKETMRYASRAAAQKVANFLKQGCGEDFQSINVVSYPKKEAKDMSDCKHNELKRLEGPLHISGKDYVCANCGEQFRAKKLSISGSYPEQAAQETEGK